MNAKLIHPAGIVLRKTFLSGAGISVPHYLYRTVRLFPTPENRLRQPGMVLSQTCLSTKNS